MTEREIITVCGWCQPERVTILRSPREPGETLVITITDRGISATLVPENPVQWAASRPLQVSHGICPTCAERLKHLPAAPPQSATAR